MTVTTEHRAAKQSDNDTGGDAPVTDSGLISLVTIAGLHGIAADLAQLQHEFGRDAPFTAEQVQLAARSLGLRTRALRLTIRSKIDIELGARLRRSCSYPATLRRWGWRGHRAMERCPAGCFTCPLARRSQADRRRPVTQLPPSAGAEKGAVARSDTRCLSE